MSRQQGPVFFHRYKNEIILAVCWAAVQAFLFYQHGIVTEYEARKYINEADNIIENGKVSSPNFWFYSTQIFLLAIVKKLQAGFIVAILVHWFFNAWATLGLYRLSRQYSKTTGLIVGLIFIFTLPLQTFNSFLQTESLFFSLTILFSCYLLSLHRLTRKNFTAVFLFLILVSVTRPTGLLWIPCTFLYLFFRFFRSFSFWWKVSIAAVAAIIFLFILNIALGSGGELDLMLPFREENIICGVSTAMVDINTSSNPNSIPGLWYYVTHNFDQFLRLAAARTRAFFGVTREYYSSTHNLYLCIYFYPFYLLAIAGIGKWYRANKHLLLYCVSIIGITWGTVMLTCDDWHNRFFLSIVPYIYILSAPAIKYIVDKTGKKNS